MGIWWVHQDGVLKHASTYEIMLAWLLHQYKALIAIPGASKLTSIESSMRVKDLQLNEDTIKKLNQC